VASRDSREAMVGWGRASGCPGELLASATRARASPPACHGRGDSSRFGWFRACRAHSALAWLLGRTGLVPRRELGGAQGPGWAGRGLPGLVCRRAGPWGAAGAREERVGRRGAAARPAPVSALGDATLCFAAGGLSGPCWGKRVRVSHGRC